MEQDHPEYGSEKQGALNESMPRYVYQYGTQQDAHGNPVPISSADGHKYFVIGMVRPPCDYLLSQWVERNGGASNPLMGSSPPYKSKVDKGNFRDWVGQVINATNKVGQSKAKVGVSPLMSTEARVRGYDKAKDGGYLHCIMYTHSLVNDFKACIRQYQSCGRAPGFTHRPTGPT